MIAVNRIETYRSPNHRPLIILCLILFAAAGAVAVKSRTHAIVKHGFEAQAVRDCLDSNGPASVWQSRSPFDKRYYQTCELPDGSWGIRVIQCTARGWVERTAFIPEGGTFGRLLEYLTAKAIPFVGWLSEVCPGS